MMKEDIGIFLLNVIRIVVGLFVFGYIINAAYRLITGLFA